MILILNNPLHAYLKTTILVTVIITIFYILYNVLCYSKEDIEKFSTIAHENITLIELEKNIDLYNKSIVKINLLKCDYSNKYIKYANNKLKENLIKIKTVRLTDSKSADFVIDNCNINIVSKSREKIFFTNNKMIFNIHFMKNNSLYGVVTREFSFIVEKNIVDAMFDYFQVKDEVDISLNAEIEENISKSIKFATNELIAKIYSIYENYHTYDNNESFIKARHPKGGYSAFTIKDKVNYKVSDKYKNHTLCLYSKNYNNKGS
jgi:hypothetical protein